MFDEQVNNSEDRCWLYRQKHQQVLIQQRTKQGQANGRVNLNYVKRGLSFRVI